MSIGFYAFKINRLTEVFVFHKEGWGHLVGKPGPLMLLYFNPTSGFYSPVTCYGFNMKNHFRMPCPLAARSFNT